MINEEYVGKCAYKAFPGPAVEGGTSFLWFSHNTRVLFSWKFAKLSGKKKKGGNILNAT